MKNFLKAVIFMTALTSIAAHATIYNFSYTFDDNSQITGSFYGHTNGSYVDDISNVHVFFNDTEFEGGSLFHTAWNATTHEWDNTMEALVSPVASLNNFLLSDANVPDDFNVSNYFYFVNDPGFDGVFANNLNTGDIAFDSPHNESWSLVSLPEPASYALLLTGLSLLSLVIRRRQK